MNAALDFFQSAVAANQLPTMVNLDGNAASHRALRFLKDRHSIWRSVDVRFCRYLNNVVEQDHRAVKLRCAPMLGLKSFGTAATTLAGIELAHRIRKRQFYLFHDGSSPHRSLKKLWELALAPEVIPASPIAGTLTAPPQMQQISRDRLTTKRTHRDDSPRRFPRKIFHGRGLHLLVMPSGGRYWRYNYRFAGKLKTLALGVHPDSSLRKARARHQVARALLADGIDPSALKRVSGIGIFAKKFV